MSIKDDCIKRIFRKKNSIIKALVLIFNFTANAQESEQINMFPPHDSFELESKVISEKRIINVWRPREYIFSENNYPVLYMLDGGMKEDFPHVISTISHLIERGYIAPLIVVGIQNTDRRRDLTGVSSIVSDKKIAPLTDGAKIFRKFLDIELFPEIEKRYRVNEQRTIVGESIAGLFVIETFFLKPEMFNSYISIDPSLWWNKNELVNQSSSRLKNIKSNNILKKKVKFWFTASGEITINQHTEQLAKLLRSSAPKNLIWRYRPRPEEYHHTIFRVTKENAFIWGLWKRAETKD